MQSKTEEGLYEKFCLKQIALLSYNDHSEASKHLLSCVFDRY